MIDAAVVVGTDLSHPLFAFVLPNPAAAGAAVGDMIDAIIIFFRSLGAAVGT